jgi:hypothetical protein
MGKLTLQNKHFILIWRNDMEIREAQIEDVLVSSPVLAAYKKNF